MLLQGKDGELRIAEFGLNGTTRYLEVLFCEMNFSGPTSRPRTAETLIMNRGQFDTDAHYVEGVDDPRYAPLPVTFSCKLADTTNTRVLSDWISGVTKISGTTQLYSFKSKTSIDGVALPNFADNTAKYAYRLEIAWIASSTTLGYRYEEVYLPAGEQSISESADGLTLSVNGQCYGDVTRISSFSTGYTAI